MDLAFHGHFAVEILPGLRTNLVGGSPPPGILIGHVVTEDGRYIGYLDLYGNFVAHPQKELSGWQETARPILLLAVEAAFITLFFIFLVNTRNDSHRKPDSRGSLRNAQ